MAFIAAIIIIAIIYLILISPGKKDMESFKKWLYSHRGLHDIEKGIPENTIPAFKKAVEKGYGIELDVHLTLDERAVVFHDDTLINASDTDIQIKDLKYDQLKEYKLFNTDNNIPLFTDVLDTVSGKVPLIVELKTCKDYIRLCEKVSEILSAYEGMYCIESFDPRIVKWFRKNKPGIVRGQLSANMFKGSVKISFLTKCIMTFMLLNFLSKPNFIAYAHKDKRNLSFILCRKLFRANTVAWTLESKEDLVNAKDMFDMFIFEKFIP